MLLRVYSIVSSTVYMYSNGHGIQGGYAPIPYGIHGTTNWLRPQPTLIPWIPNGLTQGR